QIETEVNAPADIRLQLAQRPGKADNSEDADEDGRHDYDRFDHQIPLHLFLPLRLLRNFLLRAFRGDDCTDRGSGELQLQVVRLDSYHYCVTIDGRDGTDDAARGDDGIAAFEVAQHLLLFFLLFLHGHKQQE